MQISKILVLGLGIVSTNVFATCNTTDKFHFDGTSNATILSLSSTSEWMVAKKTGPRNFQLKLPELGGTCRVDTYTASVVIAEGSNKCTFTFRDGPFMWNPIVEDVRCKGRMGYAGMIHDDKTPRSYAIRLVV